MVILYKDPKGDKIFTKSPASHDNNIIGGVGTLRQFTSSSEETLKSDIHTRTLSIGVSTLQSNRVSSGTTSEEEEWRERKGLTNGKGIQSNNISSEV